jgi:hypothetical protein
MDCTVIPLGHRTTASESRKGWRKMNGEIIGKKLTVTLNDDMLRCAVEMGYRIPLMLKCEYWRSEPHKIISSYVITEYCKLMLEKTNATKKAYEYAISVHDDTVK